MNIIKTNQDIQKEDVFYLRHIRNVLYYIVILLLLEGALRKWVFPELSKPLFFLKDIFVVYLYGYLFLKKKFPSNPLLTLFLLFMLAFYILIAIQSLILDYNFFVALYGWRNYCLYGPLPFIIAKYTDFKELKRIVTLICWASIPIAILAFIQYKSGITDFINKNVGTEKSEIFVVSENVVRASATFAFTTGFTHYIHVLMLMLVLSFFLPKNKIFTSWQQILFSFCFLACLAVSGSRGAYLACGISFSFLIIASFLLMKSKKGFQIILFSAIGLIMAIIIFNVVFSDQRDLILKRQEIASSSEGSIITRALANFIDLNYILENDISILGTGIGLGSGGGAYLSTGTAQFLSSETEWARHIIEAGILMGFLYILFRIVLCADVFIKSIKALSVSSNPTAFVFSSFVLLNLLIGAITGNGATYSFTWIMFGYAMCINKIFSDYDSLQMLKSEN